VATDQSFVEYVQSQSGLSHHLTFKKMFGEYALYLHGKVVAFACDNQLYLKPTEEGRAVLGKVSEHPPYPGAKPYFRIDEQLEDHERLRAAFEATAHALPMPKQESAAKRQVKAAPARSAPKTKLRLTNMNSALIRLCLALQFALIGAGCTDMLYSDAENAGRKNVEARQNALRSMKSSSAQAVAATPMSGQALVKLLSGTTHVEAYRKRSDDAKPYITTYDYYAADGTYIGSDTHSRRTVGYQDIGRWTVDADVLCLSVDSRQEAKNCYKLRVAADGTIQYWIYKPGDPFDGLLTRNVKTVRSGRQEPEYISEPSAFR
jgi:TfoX/Sxy family transcriptional regulator of competence genes